MTWKSSVRRCAAYSLAAVAAGHACHPATEHSAPNEADTTLVEPSLRVATQTAVALQNPSPLEPASSAASNQAALNQVAPNEIAAVSGEEPATSPPLDACKRASFFDFYRNARLITTDTPELAQLQIHIDYHTGAGCIAPDGFGTDLIVRLHLRTVDGECSIDSAEVRAVDWGLHERRTSDLDDRKLRFDFTAFDVLQRPGLTRSDTRAFALHNAKQAVSLLVRRGGILWYEGTNRASVLHTGVDSQGEESGCCWPATSTYYREFGVYD